MTPIDFLEANTDYKRPAHMTADQCGSLPILQGEDEMGQYKISVWSFTNEEIHAILNRGFIAFKMYSVHVPVMAVFTGDIQPDPEDLLLQYGITRKPVKTIRGFTNKIFCSMGDRDLGWIKIFGFGIGWKNLGKHKLLFSERMGFQQRYQIGNYSFKFFPRNASQN